MIFTMDGVAMPTKNPPKSRVFHTAVLTETYYEVLDVNTYQWYHSNKDIYIGAPYKGHTVTLADDHMLIAFGFVYTKEVNVCQSPSEPPAATEPPTTEPSPHEKSLD
ncbi:uncharacterized protein OCT59_000930 [Rhizophagus irregularis]|uniref:uncharacterized protein n=1 Tax=Rhizophagus irregularis TaxID=588596 RepID=UPI0019E3B62C|nr:hypothetical protein OCT59_000930 [Rhizophagus irregularis]GBC28546.2 hypothetical protein GLOIN_2v1725607 [Rhizophagus irregularis DAOM 181602=DAOM 197198]